MMNIMYKAVLCIIFASLVHSQNEITFQSALDSKEFQTDQFVKALGYPLESYVVETEDGYLLTLHRVPYGKNNTQKTNRTPLLLMHGLLGSSENFMLRDTKKSLAFMAAEAGFDVWLANARGTMHSRKHKHLNPDKDKSYWDFSWHEIGVYDLPVIIDYVLKKNGSPFLEYVGHSQGCTVLFVLASEKPEYKAKISNFVALAPAVYFKHFNHIRFNDLIQEAPTIYESLIRLNMHEFLGKGQDSRYLISAIAKVYPNLLIDVLLYVFGESDEFSRSCLPMLSLTIPAGASSKQILHFTQGYKLKSFRKFDYGKKENLRRYNSTLPPLYNVKQMDIPIYIFRSQMDYFASMKDVQFLANTLTNVGGFYTIPVKKFSHLDFIAAKHLDKLVNNRILNICDQYRR